MSKVTLCLLPIFLALLLCIHQGNGQIYDSCNTLCGGERRIALPWEARAGLTGRQYLGPQRIYHTRYNPIGKVEADRVNPPSPPLPPGCFFGLFCSDRGYHPADQSDIFQIHRPKG